MHPLILNLEQGSPAWLEYRRTKIGASDAAAILGICPWTTPLMLWEAKVSGATKPDNVDMARGREREPFVRRMICEQYFRKYEPVVLDNPNYDFGFASLDGWDEKADIKILEIKCPRQHSKVLPSHHMAQLQWQMMIAGVDEALYVSYDGDEIIELIVKADAEWKERLIIAGKAFYWHLVEMIPPDPTDRDLVEIVDPNALKLAERYSSLCEEIKDLEEIKKKVRDDLMIAANGKSSKIGLHRFVRYFQSGRIDFAAIPELKDVPLDKYRKKPIECWRFT